MKARWKIALASVLLVAAGGVFPHAGMRDEVRDTWRDLKSRAKEMVGMRSSSSDAGCPMMGGGGMMGGGMMGGAGGAPNEQWRGRDAARPANPERAPRR